MKAADSIRQQLLGIMEKQGQKFDNINYNDPTYYRNVKRCILEGFFMQVPYIRFESLRSHTLSAPDII